MADATKDLAILRAGKEGTQINMPMGDTEVVFKGTMVAQDATDGGVANVGTANSGQVVGVATHGEVGGAATGDTRIWIETDRIFIFNNAAGPNDCEETLAIGADVFAEDDNTISDNDQAASLEKAGVFYGLEDGGTKVRVYVGPQS